MLSSLFVLEYVHRFRSHDSNLSPRLLSRFQLHANERLVQRRPKADIFQRTVRTVKTKQKTKTNNTCKPLRIKQKLREELLSERQPIFGQVLQSANLIVIRVIPCLLKSDSAIVKQAPKQAQPDLYYIYIYYIIANALLILCYASLTSTKFLRIFTFGRLLSSRSFPASWYSHSRIALNLSNLQNDNETNRSPFAEICLTHCFGKMETATFGGRPSGKSRLKSMLQPCRGRNAKAERETSAETERETSQPWREAC